jgi:hypothetical protein
MCGSLPETCRALVADSLESLEPHEPILLLAVMTGSFKSLPRDVRAWFGKNADSKIAFHFPDEQKRRHFFQELLEYVKKAPSQFPDAVKRRRRVLEVLPVAPPLPPREPTPAEKAAQERQDTLLFYKLKSHLNSIFSQCRKADNKFCKATIGQTFGAIKTEDGIWWGKPKRTNHEAVTSELAGATSGGQDNVTETADGENPVAPRHEFYRNRLNDIDMTRIHDWVWEGRYLTSNEFLDAVRLVRQNAEMEKDDDDPESKEMFKRADKIFGIAQEEVGRTEPMFNLETERMAERFRAKRRKAMEEKEKEEAEKADGNVANGDSAMITSSPKETPNAEDRASLKRARDDEMQDSDGPHPPKRIKTSPFGADEGEGAKNVRFAERDDALELPAIALNGDTINDTIMSDHLDPPSPSPAVKLPTNDSSSSAKAVDIAPAGLTQQVIHAPSRTPSPGLSTPPTLNVTPSLFSALEETLAIKTANLNIEQLEALRASCLNVVWAHRGDWDRDNLMVKMNDVITKYLVDLGEISEDEE